MDVYELTDKIAGTLDEYKYEYSYDGIVAMLNDNPDVIYDRLVILAKSGDVPADTFYDVVEFERLSL